MRKSSERLNRATVRIVVVGYDWFSDPTGRPRSIQLVIKLSYRLGGNLEMEGGKERIKHGHGH